MGGSSYSYLLGPAIALAAVGVLALLLRWTYGSGTPSSPRLLRSADYGLLATVATVPDRGEAERLRALLRSNGIRATLGSAADGGSLVLVFRRDERRARDLLAPSGG